MKAIIVSYTLKNAKQNQKLLIHRLLYGYEDFSNNGDYNYQRKGLIETCNGKKLNRGVFIIPVKFEDKIIPLLKKNKASLQIIPVVLP
jgi:hypothetical protein